MFRLTSRLSLSWGGTLPTAIRWASPSAMAVFPTPGSPTRAGLFLFFRHRMPMTVSISRSRPITGSIADAFVIKSSLNCSSSFVATASFFPPVGKALSRCSHSTVWVNSTSWLIPKICSSCPAPLSWARESAASTWMGRISREALCRASRADKDRISQALSVSPWGSGRFGVPMPYKSCASGMASSGTRPQPRRMSCGSPGSSSSASSRWTEPTKLCPSSRAFSPEARINSLVMVWYRIRASFSRKFLPGQFGNIRIF